MGSSQTWILIIVLVTLVLLSAIFSASEIAFSSLNIIRIRQIAKKNSKEAKKAKKVFKIAANFNRTISSIIVGNNIINITISSITTAIMIDLVPNGAGVLYATIIITIVILVFGEIIPKALGKQHAESFAMKIASALEAFIFISKPITIWFSLLQDLTNKLAGAEDKVSVTKDELIEIVQSIEHEDVLEQTEREIIQSAIDFDENKVKDVMKLWGEVIYVYETSRIEKVVQIFLEHKYSRVPVMNRKTGLITGILHERDFFGSIVSNKKPSIRKLMKPATFIPQRQSLSDALEKIQKGKAHMAIVIDALRAKNVIGIITLEDVLEELVGEIYDEYDDLPNYVVEIGHHMYEVDANISFRDFFAEYLEDTKKPRTKMRTFNGWLKELKKDGKIKNGDKFIHDNIEMKVIKQTAGTVERLELTAFTKADKLIA